MPRNNSPDAYQTVSDESDFAPSPPAKRTRSSSTKPGRKRQTAAVPDIEDANIPRAHGADYHSVDQIIANQTELLSWFENVREKRGMPWRKRYDPDMAIQDKGQRAYEIWVSEVMLQQTQVATVIDYWRRWMERWPTIADLAQADVEQVNAAWRGLGYYRRARSLLKGAQTVMGDPKFNGRLPKDPTALEKQVDGVGRYTAGAISSMAYGVRAPIVDGNVHRLLTRLLAVHATQTSPATIKFLWQAAEELVDALPADRGVAGDWNQALMELGSQICKPVGPDCSACPLRPSCRAHAELKAPPPPSLTPCTLCEPIPGSALPSVTVFPMKKAKKESREEHEVVCVVEWQHGDDRRWLFTKRPDKGLLAGLFQPPTTPIPAGTDAPSRLSAAIATVQTLIEPASPASHRTVTSIPHIFSHINMTYHITHLTLTTPTLPATTGVWLDSAGVEAANVGTGVKKVWSEIYGSWGSFDVSPAAPPKKPRARAAKNPALGDVGTKVVRKIMMPAMPVRVPKG